MRREFEGYYTTAYMDSGGVWTVGTGHTYNYREKRKVMRGDAITWDENIVWSSYATGSIVTEVNKYITQPLTPEQSTAICDYIYNRGIGNFLKSQLDELINKNPNDPRIGGELRGTGLRDRLGNMLNGLVRRRKSEAFLYENGVLKFKF